MVRRSEYRSLDEFPDLLDKVEAEADDADKALREARVVGRGGIRLK